MSIIPSAQSTGTGRPLNSFPLEILAEIVEYTLEPTFFFLDISDDDDRIRIPSPALPPIALTCRTLYAEWVRLKGKSPGVWHTFACGRRARVDPNRDIFVLNIPSRDQLNFHAVGTTAVTWRGRRPHDNDWPLMRHLALEYPTPIRKAVSGINLSRLMGNFPAMTTLHILIPNVPADTTAPQLRTKDLELSQFHGTGHSPPFFHNTSRVARTPRFQGWQNMLCSGKSVRIQVHLVKQRDEASRSTRPGCDILARPRDGPALNSAVSSPGGTAMIHSAPGARPSLGGS